MTESELAQHVVTWLQDHKWTVYQEVSLYRAGGIRADIYATMGNITWAIETKMSFGLQVISQAREWTNHAHYTSIAVPYRKYNSATNSIEKDILDKYGIGMIYLRDLTSTPDDPYFEVKEECRPKLHRQIQKPELHERYKTYSQAGNSNCDYFSAFKETKENLIRMVTKNNPIRFTELIEKVDYHYKTLSTAKSCLRNLVGTSAIPELETYHEGNKLMVRIKSNCPLPEPKAKPRQLAPIISKPKVTDDFADFDEAISQFKKESLNAL